MIASPQCELCQRVVPQTTRHHLIPRTLHSNKWFKKRYTRAELEATVDLCSDCHGQIHRFFSPKIMGRSFHTLEKLQAYEQVQRFVAWLQR